MITPPAPITTTHDVGDFDCGRPTLTWWLQKHALKNEGRASRTYVVCTRDNRVVGYYALAAGSVEHAKAPGRIKRGTPNPIPLIVLGRLAVDVAWQGRGIGYGLLRDALQRCLQAGHTIGARAVLVHALDENTRDFYLSAGFVTSPIEEMTLMLNMRDISQLFEAE